MRTLTYARRFLEDTVQFSAEERYGPDINTINRKQTLKVNIQVASDDAKKYQVASALYFGLTGALGFAWIDWVSKFGLPSIENPDLYKYLGTPMGLATICTTGIAVCYKLKQLSNYRFINRCQKELSDIST